MMSCKLKYLLPLVLLCVVQVYAGVVEDAEEELKKMGRGQEQRFLTETSRNVNSYPTQSSSASRQSGSQATKSSKNARAKAKSPATSADGASTVSASAGPEEATADTGRAKADKMEKQQGRLMSLAIVLEPALLIFVATVAGKRLGKTE